MVTAKSICSKSGRKHKLAVTINFQEKKCLNSCQTRNQTPKRNLLSTRLMRPRTSKKTNGRKIRVIKRHEIFQILRMRRLNTWSILLNFIPTAPAGSSTRLNRFQPDGCIGLKPKHLKTGGFGGPLGSAF